MIRPKEWIVYGLIDPRDQSVFYVGLSTDPDKRLSQHKTDPASPAYGVCQVIGSNIKYCVFGRFWEKKPAKVLEGRLILAMPQLVNRKSHHGLPSSILCPDWQDLRVHF